MANRRMISAEIGRSESLAAVSEWAQLVWCYLIPHFDDFGIIEASAAKIKATIMPLSKREPTDFADALAELIAVDTVIAYVADQRVYLRAPNFDRHQSGLHRRTRSRHPVTGTVVSGDVFKVAAVSRKFPEVPGSVGNVPEVPGQQNGTEQNRTEQKKDSSSEPAGPDSDVRNGKKSGTKPFDESGIEYQAAAYMLASIRRYKPDLKQPNLQKWSTTFDAIFRIDKRDPGAVRSVLDFCAADPFEQRNVLSPDKLRSRFDQLELKASERTEVTPPARPVLVL